MLDADTFTSPASHEIALLGRRARSSRRRRTRVRPASRRSRWSGRPGTTPKRDKAMGFCLYNNVAVAAAQAIADGVERVAIVDIDVHHGNGTQWMFYDDPRVLYISSPPVPVLPGHRRRRRSRAAATGRASPSTSRSRPARPTRTTTWSTARSSVPVLDAVRAAADADLGRLRRARGGSAGVDADDGGRLHADRPSARGLPRLRSGALALVTEGGYDLRGAARVPRRDDRRPRRRRRRPRRRAGAARAAGAARRARARRRPRRPVRVLAWTII